MFRAIGSLFIVPTAVLLTLSFFVLVVNQKQEKLLRIFGFVVAVLLWVGAFMVFSAGNYIGSHGYGKMMEMHKTVMQCPMMKDGGMCPMMKGMGGPRVPVKTMPMRHNMKMKHMKK
ncbi:MAG: hypothetical protein WC527_05570 [Candidatus Margulisiibacteriota bacterium]